MAKRWKQRPEGSTWGDWGDDDELGRINLLTPEKVLEGVREVQAGTSFCLSLPLDFPGGTSLNQRRYPPRLAPTEDLDGNPEVFYNVLQKEIPKYGNRRHVECGRLGSAVSRYGRTSAVSGGRAACRTEVECER